MAATEDRLRHRADPYHLARQAQLKGLCFSGLCILALVLTAGAFLKSRKKI